MSRTDYSTLVNRGRRAGLNTTELYSALSSRQPRMEDMAREGSDVNGYRAGVNAAGQLTFQPASGPSRG